MTSSKYERSVSVSVPPNRVFKAFTDVHELRVWHGTAEPFEPRIGGRVRFADPGYPAVEGTVEEAVQPQRLRWRVEGDQSVIEERFEPHPAEHS